MQAIFDVIRNGAHTDAAVAIATYSGDINAHTSWLCGHILFYAVVQNCIPAIEALAARGDVHLQAQTTIFDSLWWAIGRPNILRAVIRCFPGVDVSARKHLYLVASYGCIESVQLLLNAGADPTLCEPHKVARRHGHEAVAVLIEQHVAWANGLRRVWTRAGVDASSVVK